jgi:RNA-directed DNA polymerase
MNATACAAFGSDMTWHEIDWTAAHRRVKKLQARIVKATQEGRWNKVKALQWLLTHSFSAKALAVKRVTENQGKKTPGVDRERWSTPEAKTQALASLHRKGYQALPLRRVHIPKANGKTRPLGIPTMRDRAMQALHLLALEPVAETTADKNSYGFRPMRSTADAMCQAFTCLAKGCSPPWILEADIQGCFDHINHDWLSNHVPMDKRVLQQWLKAGYVYQGRLFPTREGTPQGGIISPTLANMTLDGIEALLSECFGKPQTFARAKYQVNLVRYADDFIITGRTRELLENEVKPLIEQFLIKRGLQLSDEKTRVIHIEEGFDFLGWNFRKYDGQMLTKPSKKNVQNFLINLREAVKKNPTAKAENLINLLNPKIRGWANYHRGAAAKEAFSKVDKEIWQMIWAWAERRHPNKGARWVKNNYFKQQGSRNWVFSAQTTGRDGEKRTLRLRRASDVKIERHNKIKGDANPFDPAYEAYFEQRLTRSMAKALDGKAYTLWKSQSGICPICQQPLTAVPNGEEKWHVHHIIPKAEGGGDHPSNLVMVHPNCHRQIHSRKLKVVKTGSGNTGF